MKRIIGGVLTAVVISLAACQQKGETVADNTTTEVSAPAETDGFFGEKIDENGTMDIATLTTEMQGKDSMAVKIKTTILETCKKKGCWMNVVAGDGSNKQMKVTFKDYGFFVPKDSTADNREAIMTGVARWEMIDVKTLRHYAEDAGKSQAEIDAITEPEKQLVFEASGVIIKNLYAKN